MFEFSDNEFEEEGDFDMINQLNEVVPDSPKREQPQPSANQEECSNRSESAPART